MAHTSANATFVAGLQPVELIDIPAAAPEQDGEPGNPFSIGISLPDEPPAVEPGIGKLAAPAVLGDELIVIDEAWTGEDIVAGEWIDCDWFEEGGDYTTSWTTLVGDINGDGFEDGLLETSSLVAGVYSSASYIVYGLPNGTLATEDAASINGGNGFELVGGDAENGLWVQAAGDLNGDGLADLLASTYDTEGNASFNIVYGAAAGFGAELDVTAAGSFSVEASGIDGTEEFWVSVVGDDNGDGYADLMVDVYGTDADGNGFSFTYVIFGKASGFDAVVDVSTLSAEDGRVYVWEDSGEYIAVDIEPVFSELTDFVL